MSRLQTKEHPVRKKVKKKKKKKRLFVPDTNKMKPRNKHSASANNMAGVVAKLKTGNKNNQYTNLKKTRY